MLYGPRGSGKSTQMYRALEQLQDDFLCLAITLQASVDFRSLDSFWTSFGRRLCSDNKHVNLPNVTSAADFADLLSEGNKEKLFKGKNVVLFVDEFDLLYQAPQEVLDSFLNTLRGIKQQRAAYCLQSFIGIGPFSILALTGKSSSPFNVRDAVQVLYWTREEVHQLFSQYSTTIDSRIVDDIYERTAGHPGLVCLCGKVIDEKEHSLAEHYDLWLQYAIKHLEEKIISWPTMQKMVETLCSSSAYAKGARTLLRQRFLPSGVSAVALHTQKEVTFGKFLAAEGALRSDGTSSFYIPSPLVHKLLLERVVITDKRRTIPKKQIPYINEGTSVDVADLIESAVACIDPMAIQRAFRASFKRSRIPGLKRDFPVPQESVYQQELFSILRQWFSDEVEIDTQVNLPSGDSNSRCDMIIEPSIVSRIVVELVANAPVSVIKEHYSRAIEYGKHLNATEVWVIHFTIKEEGEDFQYPWPEGEALNVIHIWHDSKFSNFKLFCSKK